MRRRHFLAGLGAAAFAPVVLTGCNPSPLNAPDANGLMLPNWFTSRRVASIGQPIPGTSYTLPAQLDGAGIFTRPNGGWIYCVNHEIGSGGGGVTSIRFDPDGAAVGAKRVLSGTSRNCAGGITPWGTWLSCEEVDGGLVYECDPRGDTNNGVARPLLGAFVHEAAAVDPSTGVVYLTEDAWPGRVMQFTPTIYGDLTAGTLTQLAGGYARPEGCWWDDVNGRLVFCTTGDHSIWQYTPGTGSPTRIYNGGGDLTQPDNVTTSPTAGAIYACEDDGNFELVLVRETGETFPVVRVTQRQSELTGVCFTPDMTRLYFCTQGYDIYEIAGPWRWLDPDFP